MGKEELHPSVEYKIGVPAPLWSEQELITALRKFQIEDPFDSINEPMIHQKRISVEGYPLTVSLFYRAPRYVQGEETYIPFGEETVFRAVYDQQGNANVQEFPVHFGIHADEASDVQDLSARILYKLQFENGEEIVEVYNVEDNDEVDHSYFLDKSGVQKNWLMLPGNPRILSATNIVFHQTQ